jgi:PilZ domain
MGEDFSNPRDDSGQSHRVQRTVPRYSVLAVAELVETESTMCIVGKMTQISRKGCYVSTPGTPRTPPVDTFVNVIISRDGKTFVTNGKIIYAHERIGVGIVFVDSSEEQLKILDSWLADAAQAQSP